MTVYKKDSPAYFLQSVQSMLAQTVLTNDFVLVCDGELTPELDQAIDTAFAAHKNILNLIRLPQNVGLGQALNEGLARCKNELVARMDADDIALPNRCELELAAFEKEPDLVVVGSDMYEFTDNPNHPVSIKKMPATPQEIYKFGKRRNPFNHSTVMMKKSIVQKLGGYAPLRRSQDFELFTRLLRQGCKGRNIAQPLLKFRAGHARMERRKNWSNFKCDLSVYRRNYEQKYMGLLDYGYVVFRQIVLFIMPVRIANTIYNKLYRQPVKGIEK